MRLHVQREGNKVVVKLPTVLDRYYTFAIDMVHETTAELLARDMDRRLETAIRLARESAYNDGWRAAKAKKAAKDTWFSNMLEVL